MKKTLPLGASHLTFEWGGGREGWRIPQWQNLFFSQLTNKAGIFFSVKTQNKNNFLGDYPLKDFFYHSILEWEHPEHFTVVSTLWAIPFLEAIIRQPYTPEKYLTCVMLVGIECHCMNSYFGENLILLDKRAYLACKRLRFGRPQVLIGLPWFVRIFILTAQRMHEFFSDLAMHGFFSLLRWLQENFFRNLSTFHPY